MDEFDGFEAERRKGIRAVFSKYSDRILHLESFRPWLVGLGALGALIAALSRLDPDGTPGLVALIVGVVFAFVGAACAAAMDFKKIELGAQLKSLEELAEKAIQLGREVAADRKKLEEGAAVLDRRRRGRLQAIEQMLQAIEAGLLASDEDAKKATAATMLRRSITSIRNAVDYHATEFFTVSIFRREDERMANRRRVDQPGPCWKRWAELEKRTGLHRRRLAPRRDEPQWRRRLERHHARPRRGRVSGGGAGCGTRAPLQVGRGYSHFNPTQQRGLGCGHSHQRPHWNVRP